MSILCLTGWQQPYNALANIVPEALHFDYDAYDNAEAMFAALPKTPALAIGWSLGGQLLVRAVANGYVRPERLMLLGAPFQFRADAHFSSGAPAANCDAFRAGYESDPEKTLAGFIPYIALHDRHAASIARALNSDKTIWKNGLYWLDELYRARCRSLCFSAFPETIIVHGAEDKVVHFASASAFAERILDNRLLVWEECAHAPHLHNAETLRQRINEYV